MANPPPARPPAPGAPADSAGSPKTSVVGPTILLVIGLVALAVGIIGAGRAFDSRSVPADPALSYSRAVRLDDSHLHGVTGAQLTGGESYALICASVIDPTSASVTGDGEPADQSVSASRPATAGRFTFEGATYDVQAVFTPHNSGRYTVRYEPSDSGYNSACVVSPHPHSRVWTGAAAGALPSILASIVLLLVGLALTIGGGLWGYSRWQAARPMRMAPKTDTTPTYRGER